MKKSLIAGVAFSCLLSQAVFAAEGNQPAVVEQQTASLEQMKNDHVKKIDARIQSLQRERECAMAAKNHDELRACRLTHRGEMQSQRDALRMRKGAGGAGTMPAPQSQ